MTTPDPATLREALDRLVINANETNVERWELVEADLAAVEAAARRWLDLIEGGEAQRWCETHHAQWREPGRSCYPSSLDVWLDGDCVEVKRLLVEP